MYHYQKNIGDYRSATMHFSLLEHGVYNQLLDWYYLDELPLPDDNRTLFRRLSAKTETEQQAVLDVLSEMFVLTEAGWSHKRVEREIEHYRAKAQQAREAGKLGGRPPKKGIGSCENRDGFENKPDAKPTKNQEPLTINQEPLENITSADADSPAGAVPVKPKRDRSALTCADLITKGVDKDVAESFMLLRKTRRSPVTQLVVDQIAKEAATVGKTLSQALATCVARGWQGYKAEWDTGTTAQPQQPASPGYKPFIPSSQRGQS